VSDTAPTSPAPSSLTVWLAGPPARSLFTPEAQTAEDLTRWRDIVNTRKREEWEVSRALLAHVRTAMGERVQSAPEGVALSLSHSGGYAAVAASRVAVRVGVDLECERPRDMTRIAQFAFAERECAQLEALATASERVERFYVLWTLKEAFAKALSLPLLASLRQCTFSEVGGEWRGSVPTESAWVARVFRASPTLVLSVVAVLPERDWPDDFRVSTHEWPAPTAMAWRTVAALRSGA
jgi:4'-phosphopantetheinyl transferase